VHGHSRRPYRFVPQTEHVGQRSRLPPITHSPGPRPHLSSLLKGQAVEPLATRTSAVSCFNGRGVRSIGVGHRVFLSLSWLLTDWASTQPAEAMGSRSLASRTRSRKASCSRSTTPTRASAGGTRTPSPMVKVVRQLMPRAPGAVEVEDGVHDAAPRMHRWTATRARRGHQRLDQLPLCVGQVGRIALVLGHKLSLATSATSVTRRHAESLSQHVLATMGRRWHRRRWSAGHPQLPVELEQDRSWPRADLGSVRRPGSSRVPAEHVKLPSERTAKAARDNRRSTPSVNSVDSGENGVFTGGLAPEFGRRRIALAGCI
jgi:hypothetical protein